MSQQYNRSEQRCVPTSVIVVNNTERWCSAVFHRGAEHLQGCKLESASGFKTLIEYRFLLFSS